MGVSMHDKQKGDRKYSSQFSARYALDNANGVRLLLANYNALKSRQYLGDYDATIILIDLETAISKASLTDRQRQALRLVFEEDLTQAEAGKRMDIVQKNVSEAVERAVNSIADVYFYWANHGEGYDIVKTKGDGIDDEQISAT
ncbi:sigma factor-like helix-turn-helix DNA-binding protein [Gottfriedia sp. S16(2024)]|uniref:sigma factor-like helix-turn-helix DNA-binding protein n=1 Tax=Gottfriedia sp. S16(2024) TaxID=3162883 RepID=UPI003D228D20